MVRQRESCTMLVFPSFIIFFVASNWISHFCTWANRRRRVKNKLEIILEMNYLNFFTSFVASLREERKLLSLSLSLSSSLMRCSEQKVHSTHCIEIELILQQTKNFESIPFAGDCESWWIPLARQPALYVAIITLSRKWNFYFNCQTRRASCIRHHQLLRATNDWMTELTDGWSAPFHLANRSTQTIGIKSRLQQCWLKKKNNAIRRVSSEIASKIAKLHASSTLNMHAYKANTWPEPPSVLR